MIGDCFLVFLPARIGNLSQEKDIKSNGDPIE